jgi:hypothetical protein
MWLPIIGKTPKGEKPQGRQLRKELASLPSGSGAIILWRGVKDQERIIRK